MAYGLLALAPLAPLAYNVSRPGLTIVVLVYCALYLPGALYLFVCYRRDRFDAEHVARASYGYVFPGLLLMAVDIGVVVAGLLGLASSVFLASADGRTGAEGPPSLR